ncbi:type II toxin-antitoxin system Phd/YefM family antitoxin [Pseudonocardia sp. TMWB2A]|uniref:type II toxin-antitoxin system Phd/YefM family antitoxin n=1 Tax=Pseudonocardia sp. TMWB2A TaxID=687430 RepID=UPI00307F207E
MGKIISSREFNQDVSRIKKEALKAPVIITDRGKPAHVLMSIEEYRRLRNELGKSGKKRSIIDALSHPASAEIDVEFPRSRSLPREMDFD